MSDYRPIVRVEEAAETVKTVTVAELRKLAEDLGIDHKGLKKADLEAAIAQKQEPPVEEPTEPAQPAQNEESA